MGLKEDFETVLSSAEQQNRQAYQAFASAMSEQDQKLVAAHLMFAMLHAAVCQFAYVARERGHQVRIDRSAGSFRAEMERRTAKVSCWLNDDTLTLELMAVAPRMHYERRTIVAPADLDQLALFSCVRLLANEIAGHLSTT